MGKKSEMLLTTTTAPCFQICWQGKDGANHSLRIPRRGCILVDEKDRVVGHDTKYNCHLMENIESKNLLHRAFSAFLFNSKYELLLQHHVPGVRNAAQRKLLDELGIPAEDVPVDQFIPLGRILYKAPSDVKWGEHELDYLLFMVRDVNMMLNPDEVADVKYVNREQLKELSRKADTGEEAIPLVQTCR